MAPSPAPASGRRAVLAVASLRLVLLAVAACPAWLAAQGALGRTFRDAWLADAGTPLPVMQLVGLLGRAGPAAFAGVLAGLAIFLLVHQAFVGGAAAALLPRRHGSPATAGWGRIFREGTPRTWTMLRVTLLGAVLLPAGALALSLPFRVLGRMADRAGWSALALLVGLGGARLLLFACWGALLGTFLLHVRAHLVARDEHRVRRALLPSLAGMVRAPFRAAALPAFLLLAGPLLGGVPLALWRLAPPAGGVGLAGNVLLALLGLAAQATAWTAALLLAARAAVR